MADSRESLPDIPGRGGEREREEAVEREREEAVERPLQWGWDGRQSGSCGSQGFVRGDLLMDILKILFKEPDLILHSGY